MAHKREFFIIGTLVLVVVAALGIYIILSRTNIVSVQCRGVSAECVGKIITISGTISGYQQGFASPSDRYTEYANFSTRDGSTISLFSQSKLPTDDITIAATGVLYSIPDFMLKNGEKVTHYYMLVDEWKQVYQGL